MRCAKCEGDYTGYDTCPVCAKEERKRAENMAANVSTIKWLLVAFAVVSVISALVR